jgi:hypothetical protein
MVRNPRPEGDILSRLITYKTVSDIDGRLKASARTACNFWNRFLQARARRRTRSAISSATGGRSG